MSPPPFSIDPDIRRAETLPAEVYRDPAIYSLLRERVLARSWQLAADLPDAFGGSSTCSVSPLTLLEGCLDEPLVLTRDARGAVSCLSNVCTHRANLVATDRSDEQVLRCRYHGRRFGLDGRFLSMPEFDRAVDFPRPADDLARVASAIWKRLLFVSIDPAHRFEDLIAPVESRMSPILGARTLEPDASRSRSYDIAASWIAYVDNYLEGFHIPFVHPELNAALEYGSYTTELHEWSTLQIGRARDGEEAFEPPPGSPEHGARIAGYYFWLFPTTMLNFYPWGVSVNLVRPLGPERTRILYWCYVMDRSKLGRGAGADLDLVERQDDAVVEAVQRGLRSRLYRRGRYSPDREQGVHHFHRLIAAAI